MVMTVRSWGKASRSAAARSASALVVTRTTAPESARACCSEWPRNSVLTGTSYALSQAVPSQHTWASGVASSMTATRSPGPDAELAQAVGEAHYVPVEGPVGVAAAVDAFDEDAVRVALGPAGQQHGQRRRQRSWQVRRWRRGVRSWAPPLSETSSLS